MAEPIIEQDRTNDPPKVIAFNTRMEFLTAKYYFHDIIKQSPTSKHYIVEPIDAETTELDSNLIYLKQIIYQDRNEYNHALAYYQKILRYCKMPFAKNDIIKINYIHCFDSDSENYYELIVLTDFGESDRIDVENIEKDHITKFLKNVCLLLKDLKDFDNIYHGNLFIRNIILVNGDLKISGFKPVYDDSKHKTWRHELARIYSHARMDLYLIGLLWLRFLNINIEQDLKDDFLVERVESVIVKILGDYSYDSKKEIFVKLLDLQKYPELTLEDIIFEFNEYFVLENIKIEKKKKVGSNINIQTPKDLEENLQGEQQKIEEDDTKKDNANPFKGTLRESERDVQTGPFIQQRENSIEKSEENYLKIEGGDFTLKEDESVKQTKEGIERKEGELITIEDVKKEKRFSDGINQAGIMGTNSEKKLDIPEDVSNSIRGIKKDEFGSQGNLGQVKISNPKTTILKQKVKEIENKDLSKKSPRNSKNIKNDSSKGSVDKNKKLVVISRESSTERKSKPVPDSKLIKKENNKSLSKEKKSHSIQQKQDESEVPENKDIIDKNSLKTNTDKKQTQIRQSIEKTREKSIEKKVTNKLNKSREKPVEKNDKSNEKAEKLKEEKFKIQREKQEKIDKKLELEKEKIQKEAEQNKEKEKERLVLKEKENEERIRQEQIKNNKVKENQEKINKEKDEKAQKEKEKEKQSKLEKQQKDKLLREEKEKKLQELKDEREKKLKDKEIREKQLKEEKEKKEIESKLAKELRDKKLKEEPNIKNKEFLEKSIEKDNSEKTKQIIQKEKENQLKIQQEKEKIAQEKQLKLEIEQKQLKDLKQKEDEQALLKQEQEQQLKKAEEDLKEKQLQETKQRIKQNSDSNLKQKDSKKEIKKPSQKILEIKQTEQKQPIIDAIYDNQKNSISGSINIQESAKEVLNNMINPNEDQNKIYINENKNQEDQGKESHSIKNIIGKVQSNILKDHLVDNMDDKSKQKQDRKRIMDEKKAKLLEEKQKLEIEKQEREKIEKQKQDQNRIEQERLKKERDQKDKEKIEKLRLETEKQIKKDKERKEKTENDLKIKLEEKAKKIADTLNKEIKLEHISDLKKHQQEKKIIQKEKAQEAKELLERPHVGIRIEEKLKNQVNQSIEDINKSKNRSISPQVQKSKSPNKELSPNKKWASNKIEQLNKKMSKNLRIKGTEEKNIYFENEKKQPKLQQIKIPEMQEIPSQPEVKIILISQLEKQLNSQNLSEPEHQQEQKDVVTQRARYIQNHRDNSFSKEENSDDEPRKTKIDKDKKSKNILIQHQTEPQKIIQTKQEPDPIKISQDEEAFFSLSKKVPESHILLESKQIQQSSQYDTEEMKNGIRKYHLQYNEDIKKAKDLLSHQNYKEAIDYLTILLPKYNDRYRIDILKMLCVVNFKLKNLEEARLSLLDALEFLEENKTVYLQNSETEDNMRILFHNLAIILFEEQRYNDALEVLNHSLFEQQDKVPRGALMLKGDVLLALNRPQEAFVSLNAHLKALILQEPDLELLKEVLIAINKIVNVLHELDSKPLTEQFLTYIFGFFEKVRDLLKDLGFGEIKEQVLFNVLEIFWLKKNPQMLEFILKKVIDGSVSIPFLNSKQIVDLARFYLRFINLDKQKEPEKRETANQFLSFAETLLEKENSIDAQKLKALLALIQGTNLIKNNKLNESKIQLYKCIKIYEINKWEPERELFVANYNAGLANYLSEDLQSAEKYLINVITLGCQDKNVKNKSVKLLAKTYYRRGEFDKCASFLFELLQDKIRQNSFGKSFFKYLTLFYICCSKTGSDEFDKILAQLEKVLSEEQKEKNLSYFKLFSSTKNGINPNPENEKYLEQLANFFKNQSSQPGKFLSLINLMHTKFLLNKNDEAIKINKDLISSLKNSNLSADQNAENIENFLFNFLFVLIYKLPGQLTIEERNKIMDEILEYKEKNKIYDDVYSYLTQIGMKSSPSKQEDNMSKSDSMAPHELQEDAKPPTPAQILNQQKALYEQIIQKEVKDFVVQVNVNSSDTNRKLRRLNSDEFEKKSNIKKKAKCSCFEISRKKGDLHKLIEDFLKQMKNMIFLDVTSGIEEYFRRFEETIKEKNINFEKFSYVKKIIRFYLTNDVQFADPLKMENLMTSILDNSELCIHDFKMMIILFEAFRDPYYLDFFIHFLDKTHPKIAKIVANQLFIEHFNTKYERIIGEFFEKINADKFSAVENFPLMHLLEAESHLHIPKQLAFSIYNRFRYEILGHKRFFNLFSKYIPNLEIKNFYFKYNIYLTIINLVKSKIPPLKIFTNFVETFISIALDNQLKEIDYQHYLYDFLVIINLLNFKDNDPLCNRVIEFLIFAEEKLQIKNLYCFSYISSVVAQILFKYKKFEQSNKCLSMGYEIMKKVTDSEFIFPKYIQKVEPKEHIFNILTFICVNLIELGKLEMAETILKKLEIFDFQNSTGNIKKDLLLLDYYSTAGNSQYVKENVPEIKKKIENSKMKEYNKFIYKAAVDKISYLNAIHGKDQIEINRLRDNSRESINKLIKESIEHQLQNLI